ncbi:NADPH:quinone reductase-like Zn-dependent oxidoreductase [Catenulispora sp. GP43]|uniref:zinc-binding dehydrogenase n=1 Tax=Catenulispora sp. GP43 TaxID=3156263 RepID=UPI003512DD2C
MRSQANGSHYTSTGELPLVPAPVVVAAGMNPAMCAWVALRRRIEFQAGQDVLILGATGATGSSGRMAVRIAKLFGANRVVAAGRDPRALAELPALGATETVRLGTEQTAEQLAKAASETDVVIDYVWGQPAVDALVALVTRREDPRKPLTWIEIGSTAGPTAAIPSAALRAVRLQFVGSGQGSIGPREYLAELPALADGLTSGGLPVEARTVPLADVEEAWAEESARRIVFVP